MASNPQAVIEVLGFFTQTMDHKDKKLDIQKSFDELSTYSSNQKPGNKAQNVPPPPPPPRPPLKEGSNDKLSEKCSPAPEKKFPLKNEEKVSEKRLSGLNDAALLDILSIKINK